MSNQIKNLIIEDGLERQEKAIMLKIVLLGAGGVGKTSIRRSYLGKTFKDNYSMTIGADFATKNQHVSYKGENFVLKYQIWDLAGQPIFSDVVPYYFKGALGGLLIFDLTRPETLDVLWEAWLVKLWKHSGFGTIPIYLLGNKNDVDHPIKEYIIKKAKKIADRLNNESMKFRNFSIEFFPTSAKTGLNIDIVFSKLSRAILDYMAYLKDKPKKD